MHGKNVAHRDIRPVNILVFIDEKGKITFKLADLVFISIIPVNMGTLKNKK